MGSCLSQMTLQRLNETFANVLKPYTHGTQQAFNKWYLLYARFSVQFSRSVVSDSLRPPWTAASQASLSITNSQSLLKLRSIEWVMPSNHLLFCRPLLLPPSTFPSIRVFSNESALRIRWPKDWSFSFSLSPANEYSGLIPLRMDWLDLLAVQGTLKSLQNHSSKPSILRRSAFFMVQLSHAYTTTGMKHMFSSSKKAGSWWG